MGIKLSAPAHTNTKLQAAFSLAFGGLLVVFRRVLLPHILLAAVLLIGAVYAFYTLHLPFVPYFPPLLNKLMWGGVLCLTVLLAGAYAALASTLYALYCACVYAEEFFYALFQALKDNLHAKINNLDEGVAKQQARVLLDNSMKEVLEPLHQMRFHSFSATLGHLLLGVLTLVSRSVFLARLAHLTGTTVHFSALFASRATLVGALFLNMRWLTLLGLAGCYALGGLILLCVLWIVW